jgi:MGT family glycosyltransferase
LFTVWPFAGHVHPSVAVAHALRDRGHDVGFYTGTAAQAVVEGEGFAFFAFRKVDEERTTALASSEFPYSPSLWHRVRSAPKLQAKFREWLLETIPHQVDDLEGVLSHWNPDVLVCDLAFWGPILVLGETRGIPVAVLSILAACILPGPDAPSWGMGLPRPRNGAMRLGTRFGQTALRWISAGFRAQVNAMRARYGLPPIACSVTEYAGQMPLYLVPSAPEYDYERRDLPPTVHYVGPCLWDKPTHEPPPEWLAQLPGSEPLVYVTEATIGTTEPFLLRTAARALADLPVQVVMTTGRQRSPAELDLGPVAPNVRVESYVPQSDLLPRMAVMVTLGGSGGVLSALMAGVPLVVVPTEWDRPENAQRVVEAGAGIRIAPEHCTPERLRAAVQQVISESSFRENARRLSGAFRRYGGPVRAAELLETLKARPPRREDPEMRRGLSFASGS